ncbi:short-chain dehydrogenase/reductase SDR [Caballeronia calidae]|uniref:Short-chain dehydrogenase/reductase SDR n=1 Tax=Caballeronia calidae TaxID=1777139 RepID=A0A158EFX2_9BURK|nr:SDR family oxidoreductase [Caballeronia calidae]SAL05600.1 short-chain dehydrogenase/reductase SDR [Caballeronia calidae]
MKTDTGDRVAGKVAIVTGAGSVTEGIGNGRAAALMLARQGAKVALLDINERSANDTRRMIEEEGGECFAMETDVTNPASCEEAVRRTVSQWGRLDILVNNVGTARVAGDATQVDIEAWNRGMLINVTSMMLMVRFAVPEMKKSGGGSIINISSIVALHGGHTNLFYPTSKGALLNMTRTMAGNHGPDGIRVNCICPGFLYTPVIESAVDNSGGGVPDSVRETRKNAGAIKTEGTAWDVAYGILYLASDESRWVTGVVLPIDAGVSAISPHFQKSSPSAMMRGHEKHWEASASGNFPSQPNR